MKLNQTYDLLRYDQGMQKPLTEKKNDQKRKNNPNSKNNDEITSTGSFLSSLSGVSETVDYYGDGTHKVTIERNLSKEFDDIFGDMSRNDEPTLLANKSQMEKTFQVNHTPKRENDRKNALSFSDSESDRRVQSPPKRQKRYLHVSEDFSRGKMSQLKKKQPVLESMQTITSTDVESNPVYERIDTNSSLDFESRENIRDMANTMEPQLLLDSHRCQHRFSHHTAPQSVICFLCSKR